MNLARLLRALSRRGRPRNAAADHADVFRGFCRALGRLASPRASDTRRSIAAGER